MTPHRNFGYDPLGRGLDGDVPSGPEIRIRLASPVIGEEEMDAVRNALESGILTNGPWIRRFEHEMAVRSGTEHAVAMANGTVALAAMLLAAGIGPGDEVIIPSLTFIATASSVLHVGATPVFADIEPETFNLDPDDVARRITPRTRAIVPVHYGGHMADMERFRSLADDADLRLFEDAAQAHGAHQNGRPAGSWGDAGMFSFTPIKMITTGEGGVVTTNDGDLAQKMRLLRNHGMDKLYHHEILGWNWRITEMQAALGVCQLERLDHILEVKQANAKVFADMLDPIAGVNPPVAGAGRNHPYTLYTLTVPEHLRDPLAKAFEASGIETRIYFPPAHRQPIFQGCPIQQALPVTDHVADRVVSVPFHTRVTADDLAEMADIVKDVLSTG